MPTETIRVDELRIVHETVDDEVIAVDLESGAYFSLTKTAADLWPALVTGTSRAGLLAILAATADAAPSEIEAALDRFLDELRAERIITAEPCEPTGSEPSTVAPAAGRLTRPFEPPRLEKYTNMSDLLLLDPIHDVDDQGWPRVPELDEQGWPRSKPTSPP